MILKNNIFKLIFSIFALFLILGPVPMVVAKEYPCSWHAYPLVYYGEKPPLCLNNYIERATDEANYYCGPKTPDWSSEITFTCCCSPDAVEKKVGASKVEPPKFQISLPTIKLSTIECHNTIDGGFSCSVPWIAEYITGIYDYGLSIGGILAAIILMAGGVLWLVSGGDASKVSKAKSLIFSSITGLIILFSSYVILYEINPELIKTRNINVGLPGGTKELETALKTSDDWLWDPGIKDQVGDASLELMSLLQCMRPMLASGVGRISSISDSNFIGKLNLCNTADCKKTQTNPKCIHACQSCHYGGGTWAGKSYAVDFGDEANEDVIIKAAKACGATYALIESDHVHVSTASCPKN